MACKRKVSLPRLFPHQRAVTDAISESIRDHGFGTEQSQKVFVVKSQRQVGKTAVAKTELTRFSLAYNNLTSAYIAPTFKLSKKVFKEVVKMLKPTGSILSANSTDLVIEFDTGGSIAFFSAEQRDNLRGFTVSGILVVDEAAFIRDDIYFECLSPWVDFHKARTLIISTPKFKIGFFYKFFSGVADKVIDFCSFDMSVIRSKEALEAKRKITPEAIFVSEYLGLFIDAKSGAFGDFGGCIHETAADIEKATELYVGVDWGTGCGADDTVLTALNEAGEQCFLWRTNDMTPTEQAAFISAFYDKYKDKIKKFTVELNSIGRIYYDMIKVGRPKITGLTMTNDVKRKLVECLQVAFQNGTIALMSDAAQNTQITVYESKVNEKTNTVSYNAPSGYHDDHVVALMIANKNYNSKNKFMYG